MALICEDEVKPYPGTGSQSADKIGREYYYLILTESKDKGKSATFLRNGTIADLQSLKKVPQVPPQLSSINLQRGWNDRNELEGLEKMRHEI